MSELASVGLHLTARVVAHDFAGEVSVPVPNDPALAFMTAIVEHGGDVSTEELAGHLLGDGRMPIAAQVLESARRRNLVEAIDGGRWIVTGEGAKVLRSTVSHRNEFGVWRTRFIHVNGFDPWPLDLAPVPTQSLGELHKSRTWEVDRAGAQPAELIDLWGEPFPDTRQAGASYIVLDIGAVASASSRSPMVWYPVAGSASITLDEEPESIPFHTIDVDVVGASLAEAIGGTFAPDAGAIRVDEGRLGSEAVLRGRLELDELRTQVEVRGTRMRYAGSVPVQPTDPADAQRWLVRRIARRLDRYVTDATWSSMLADNLAGLDLTASDLDEVTPELVLAHLSDEPPSERTTQLRWFLHAPKDWRLRGSHEPVMSERLVNEHHPEPRRKVLAAGKDGRLAESLTGLVDRAQSILIVSSFILAFRELERHLSEAAARGVRIYLLTASSHRLQQRLRDDRDKERLAEHKRLLATLAGQASLRSASGFHAKVLLRDPFEDPEGILSTANLVHSEVTYNDDVAVHLTREEIRHLYRQLRWSFWEQAQHELHPRTLVAIPPLALLEHPRELSPVLVTTGVHDTFSDRLSALIAEHDNIAVSTFEAACEHPAVRSLTAAAVSGKQVTVIARASNRTRASLPALRQLHAAGATVLGTERMHAKVAVFDGSTAIIGSGNLRDHDDPSRLELGLVVGGERCAEISQILTRWVDAADWELHGASRPRAAEAHDRSPSPEGWTHRQPAKEGEG